jgi:hypothetical protein
VPVKKFYLVALMCIAAIAADPKIVGGPYAVNVTSKTATIAWLFSDSDVTVQSPAPPHPFSLRHSTWKKPRSPD